MPSAAVLESQARTSEVWVTDVVCRFGGAVGTPAFDDYVAAVGWAQDYARANRVAMMASVLAVLRTAFPQLEAGEVAVNCHHNYVAREEHFGERVWVTRKGAVRAGAGELGIIPG